MPVIETCVVPRFAPLLAVNVRVLVFVVGFEENVAVTPLGRLETDRVTAPVNKLAAFTEIVLLALLPCLTDRLDGEAASVYEGGGFTTRLTDPLAVV